MDSTKIVGEKIKSLRETKEISVALLGTPFFRTQLL
jgi:hypothetical protein